MGLMAIGAGREDVGLFFPQLATNDLAMDGLDLRMALRAGGAMFLRLIEEAGSVCGNMECAVWQVAQFGATDRPFFNSASPWMLSE